MKDIIIPSDVSFNDLKLTTSEYVKDNPTRLKGITSHGAF
jgi:hypothetical protein